MLQMKKNLFRGSEDQTTEELLTVGTRIGI